MALPNPSEFQDPIHAVWIAFGAGVGGAYAAVRWWFHVRRLANADKLDGGVTASIKFVLDELHKEIATLKTEVALLKAENQQLRRDRMEARALLVSHTADEEAVHQQITNRLIDD